MNKIKVTIVAMMMALGLVGSTIGAQQASAGGGLMDYQFWTTIDNGIKSNIEARCPCYGDLYDTFDYNGHTVKSFRYETPWAAADDHWAFVDYWRESDGAMHAHYGKWWGCNSVGTNCNAHENLN